MAISFVGYSTPQSSYYAAMTIGVPSGVQQGDLLMILMDRSSNTFPTISGWAHASFSPWESTGSYNALYYKFAGASESSVSLSSYSGESVASMVAFRGTDASSPFGATGTATSGYSSSLTAASITTTKNNAQVLFLIYGMGGYGAGQQACTGATNANLSNISVKFCNMYGGYGNVLGLITSDKATAGSTGTTALTFQNADYYHARTLELYPTSSTSVSVTLDQCAATSDLNAPTVSATSNTSVTLEQATAISDVVSPSIASGALVELNQASGTSEIIALSVTIIQNANVETVICEAVSDVIMPVVSIIQNVSVELVQSFSVSEIFPPSVDSVQNISVDIVQCEANSSLILPMIGISVAVSLATCEAISGIVGTDISISVTVALVPCLSVSELVDPEFVLTTGCTVELVTSEATGTMIVPSVRAYRPVVLVAVFHPQSELTALFNSTVTIGGIYGDG